MKKLTLLLLLVSATVTAQDYQKDLDEITKAAYGYMDIFYKADTTLAYQYLDQSLRKVGWRYSQELKKYSANKELPFEKVLELALRLKKNPIPQDENTPREVEILEANDKIAMVKVVGTWGMDYLSMVKLNGQWKIINIIWQSDPKWTYRPDN